VTLLGCHYYIRTQQAASHRCYAPGQWPPPSSWARPVLELAMSLELSKHDSCNLKNGLRARDERGQLILAVPCGLGISPAILTYYPTCLAPFLDDASQMPAVTCPGPRGHANRAWVPGTWDLVPMPSLPRACLTLFRGWGPSATWHGRTPDAVAAPGNAPLCISRPLTWASNRIMASRPRYLHSRILVPARSRSQSL